MPYLSIIAIGFVFSCNFSKSPWSKNSSATSLATRCWTSHGLAIALTSQAVIIIPHSTWINKKLYIYVSQINFVCIYLSFQPPQTIWTFANFHFRLAVGNCASNSRLKSKNNNNLMGNAQHTGGKLYTNFA